MNSSQKEKKTVFVNSIAMVIKNKMFIEIRNMKRIILVRTLHILKYITVTKSIIADTHL